MHQSFTHACTHAVPPPRRSPPRFAADPVGQAAAPMSEVENQVGRCWRQLLAAGGAFITRCACTIT